MTSICSDFCNLAKHEIILLCSVKSQLLVYPIVAICGFLFTGSLLGQIFLMKLLYHQSQSEAMQTSIYSCYIITLLVKPGIISVRQKGFWFNLSYQLIRCICFFRVFYTNMPLMKHTYTCSSSSILCLKVLKTQSD